MNNINVNYKLAKEKKGKFNLRKVGAALVVSGMIFTLGACGTKEKVFEYDQDSSVSYEEQYQKSTGKSINNNDLTTILANFDIAYDNYKASIKNSNELNKVTARMNLISVTNELTSTSKVVMNEKVKEAMNITCDAEVRRDGGNNSPIQDLIKVTDNGKVNVYENIPKDMSNVLNDIEALKAYKGDGSNDVWAKSINDYSNDALSLYNDTLNVIEKDYTFDGNKITSPSKTR